MSDTLIKVVQTLNQELTDNLDIINKVDMFYSSAWDKLVLVGTVSFAVIGIIVPFVIQWYQKQTLKQNEQLLMDDFKRQATLIKEEIIVDLNKVLDEKLIKFEKKIDRINSSSNGKTFHLQGNTSNAEKNYVVSLSNYIASALYYLEAEDVGNLNIILDMISNFALERVSKEDIEDLSIAKYTNINNLLDNLEKFDDKGYYLSIIRKLRLKLKNLPDKKFAKT